MEHLRQPITPVSISPTKEGSAFKLEVSPKTSRYLHQELHSTPIEAVSNFFKRLLKTLGEGAVFIGLNNFHIPPDSETLQAAYQLSKELNAEADEERAIKQVIRTLSKGAQFNIPSIDLIPPSEDTLVNYKPGRLTSTNILFEVLRTINPTPTMEQDVISDTVIAAMIESFDNHHDVQIGFFAHSFLPAFRLEYAILTRNQKAIFNETATITEMYLNYRTELYRHTQNDRKTLRHLKTVAPISRERYVLTAIN